MAVLRRATGPGRVNLVGDHTDYNDGLALPMAIDLGVSVEWQLSDGDDQTLTATSTAFEGRAELSIGPGASVDPVTVEPRWARLIAAMVTLVPPASGGALRVDGTLPIGAGLSASRRLIRTAIASTVSPWLFSSVVSAVCCSVARSVSSSAWAVSSSSRWLVAARPQGRLASSQECRAARPGVAPTPATLRSLRRTRPLVPPPPPRPSQCRQPVVRPFHASRQFPSRSPHSLAARKAPVLPILF